MLQRLFFIFLAFWLAGCSKPVSPFIGTDISGESFGGPLQLVDFDGKPRSLADFRGRWIVLFFGYTHCPSVCPTTLKDSADALKLLTPEEARQVQILFVSVDPARDTGAMLKHYVTYFHQDFLALTGTPEAVKKAADDFRVIYRQQPYGNAGQYLVDHTAGSYVIDPKGKPLLYLPFAQPAKDIAHDLRLLLQAH